jgi:hypothetical protein
MRYLQALRPVSALAVAIATAAVAAVAACGAPNAGPTHAAGPAALHPRAGWQNVPGAVIVCHSALSPADQNALVLGVSADSASDAWGVGVCGEDGGTHDDVGMTPSGFIEHWDGRTWRRVPAPASGEYDLVRAVSPTDVWAASLAADSWASTQQSSATAMPGGPAVIHWNGRSWAPATAGLGQVVYGLVASRTAGVWALTSAGVQRYADGAWETVPGPPGVSFGLHYYNGPGLQESAFLAASSAGIWAVGDTAPGMPVLARWAGAQWTTVPVPVTRASNPITDVTANGSGVWVTFQSSDTGDAVYDSVPVLERWNGQSWMLVARAALQPQYPIWPVEIAAPGEDYGGYLLCRFPLISAQRPLFYGFAWTCPSGLNAITMTAVPGTKYLWAAGTRQQGPYLVAAFSLFAAR